MIGSAVSPVAAARILFLSSCNFAGRHTPWKRSSASTRQRHPIGRQIILKDLGAIPDPVKDPSFVIVGGTSDAKNQGIQEAVIPEVFIPYTLAGYYERGILVRTAADPLTLENSVRREIWAVDRGVALTLTGNLKGY